MINRNTYDFILDEKKKAIQSKFEKDRISREHFYKQSLESPKTQLYINIEGKSISIKFKFFVHVLSVNIYVASKLKKNFAQKVNLFLLFKIIQNFLLLMLNIRTKTP